MYSGIVLNRALKKLKKHWPIQYNRHVYCIDSSTVLFSIIKYSWNETKGPVPGHLTYCPCSKEQALLVLVLVPGHHVKLN